MTLSKRSLETLIDLVEIKLSCIDVMDREDAREKLVLENALQELAAFKKQPAAASTARVRRPKAPAISVPDTAGVAYIPQAQPAPAQLHA